MVTKSKSIEKNTIIKKAANIIKAKVKLPVKSVEKNKEIVKKEDSKKNQSVTNKTINQDKISDTINKKLVKEKLIKKSTNIKEEKTIPMKNKVNATSEKIQNEKVEKVQAVESTKSDIANSTYKHQMEDDRFDNTEVYDEGDIASALERGYILQALQKHKEKLAPEIHPDFDGESCVVCGCEIPVFRLNMGKVRCVHCQEKLEKTRKLYAQK